MPLPLAPALFVFLAAIDSPLPRQADSMMVYDGRRMLLFGGAGESASLGDFWSWDGASWTRIDASGPEPRNSGTMAYDPRRRRAVLHGGRNSQGVLTDTWEWDGARWRQIHTAAGPPPVHSVASFDPGTGEIILFGPRFGARSQPRPLPSETWSWNGRRWRRIHVVGGPTDCIPIGMAGTVLFVVRMDAEGAPKGPTETWEWRSDKWTRSSVAPPPSNSIAMPSSQLAAAKDAIVLFDGDTRTTWIWRREVWTSIAGQGPSRRSGHQLGYDRRRDRVVLFGGTMIDDRRVKLADIWEWDGNSWTHRE